MAQQQQQSPPHYNLEALIQAAQFLEDSESKFSVFLHNNNNHGLVSKMVDFLTTCGKSTILLLTAL